MILKNHLALLNDLAFFHEQIYDEETGQPFNVVVFKNPFKGKLGGTTRKWTPPSSRTDSPPVQAEIFTSYN